MDRKYCVLLYSNYSNASKQVIDHIKSLPFDFSKTTGLAFLNVDSKFVRDKIQDEQIKNVPVLLVKYFDGNLQKLENKYIYMWIKAVVDEIIIPEKKSAKIIQEANVMTLALEMQHVRDAEMEK